MTLAEKIRFVENRGGYIHEGIDTLNSPYTADGKPIKEWRCEIGDDDNVVNGVHHSVEVYDYNSMEECLDRAIAEWNESGFKYLGGKAKP